MMVVVMAWLMQNSLRRLHGRVEAVFSTSFSGRGKGTPALGEPRREMAVERHPAKEIKVRLDTEEGWT